MPATCFLREMDPWLTKMVWLWLYQKHIETAFTDNINIISNAIRSGLARPYSKQDLLTKAKYIKNVVELKKICHI